MERKGPGAEARRVAAYKTILKECLDRRPSGMRARIADAIGKHKSFVSQLTNPVYPMPIPLRHLQAIIDICHFSQEERRAFLEAYAAAHPGREVEGGALRGGGRGRRKALVVDVPVLEDPAKQRELEALIHEFAGKVGELLD